MAGLSISKAWDETRARVAADGRLMAVIAAALLLLPQAIVAVVAPPAELSGESPSSTANILALIAGIIGIVGQIALIRLALVPGTSVGESIQHGLKRLLPMIGAVLIICIVVFLVAMVVLLAVGGATGLEAAETGAATRSVFIAAAVITLLALFLSPKLLMMMPVATAERGGPVHIVKRSWTLSSGHYLRLLGFMLLILIAAVIIVVAVQFVLGAALVAAFGELDPLGPGALVYALLFGAAQAALAVLISVMLARIYAQLSGGDAPDVSVPNSGA